MNTAGVLASVSAYTSSKRTGGGWTKISGFSPRKEQKKKKKKRRKKKFQKILFSQEKERKGREKEEKKRKKKMFTHLACFPTQILRQPTHPFPPAYI